MNFKTSPQVSSEITLQIPKLLQLRHLIVFGLAYMTPIIVLGTYGILSTTTQNTVPLAYVIALVVMMLTAFSYSRMARVCTESGSAYSYVKLGLGAKLGFFAGWAILLDYLFLPMVITLIGGVYLNSLIPSVPQAVWILGILVISTGINWFGVKMADKINLMLLAIQIMILLAFSILSFYYASGHTEPFWSLDGLLKKDNLWSPVMAGAAIACYSFLGFDAITTLSEETIEPEKNVPKAILYTTLLGGLIFVVVSTILQLSNPHTKFTNPDSAASEIAKNIGGDLFVTIFVIGLSIGQLASAVAAQASGSRLIYTMARRKALPKVLAKLNKYQVPSTALSLIAVIGSLALFLNMTTSTSFINFGAFLGFMLVNISVIKYFWGQGSIIVNIIIPLFGLISTLILFFQLDKMAFILGLGWLILGVIRYLTIENKASIDLS